MVGKTFKISYTVSNYSAGSAFISMGGYDYLAQIIDSNGEFTQILTVSNASSNTKFYVTANVKTRALRRYKELKSLKKKVSYSEVLKSIKKRDKSDKNRKISPLKKTKDSILINSSKLDRRLCFLKVKKIIDRKINLNGDL